MNENSPGKWYKHPAVIAAVLGAVITGVFTILNTVISNNKKVPAKPLTPVFTPAPDVVPPVTVQTLPDEIDNKNIPKPKVEHIPEQPTPPEPIHEYSAESNSDSAQIFQDDFENGLKNWVSKRYDGYNNFMRWHISEQEHFSGTGSLSLGHEDTDIKDNNDTVHIETKKSFLLTKDAVLSFRIKKEYGRNLEVV
ncbi:MAG: hypothetical protein D3909_03505, partial [Candidatus Electrothrix sp. ATG1]|nr:hypothetical protein [Candidatus Electrothrix sp. ATG1]